MARKKRKPKNKFEHHIAEYIGKMKPGDFIDLIALGGISYVGFQVMGPAGILYGLISYKLSQSMNLVAGTAGVFGLVSLGVASYGPIGEAVSSAIEEGNRAIRIWTGKATCREKMTVYYRRLYREEPSEEWLQKQCPTETI